MVKVITYGTYDLLHYGHIRLLERAKELGDYLIVGITSDDYDRSRGKINTQQSLMERIAAVKATGLADEIIVEEYEGQKIDDIRNLGVDIFTVGSDWEGQFDYLKEYCKVIYLPRTQGVSSSDVRTEQRRLRIGIVGTTVFTEKFINECHFVNGVDVTGIFCDEHRTISDDIDLYRAESYEDLLSRVDAVYVISMPESHYADVKKALLADKHVLCESPISFTQNEARELQRIAKERKLILMEAIKTAYSTAYERLILLAKGGRIGDVVSVDAISTSLRDPIAQEGVDLSSKWNSMCSWGPAAFLPVFQVFGTDYKELHFYTRYVDKDANIDGFTKVDFIYPKGIATVKVGKAAKAEGEMVVAGTKGYIYVPAPWWKTDYFEVRYENQENNKRFFYQLDGEGIRNEIVTFVKSVRMERNLSYISEDITTAISGVIEQFNARKNLTEI